jgi:hypothetical protein
MTQFAIVILEANTTLIVPDHEFTEAQRAAVVHMVANRGKAPASPIVTEVAAAVAPVVPSPTDKVAKVGMARAQGYTGDPCTQCQGMRVKRNGSCTVCDDCGATTGCS